METFWYTWIQYILFHIFLLFYPKYMKIWFWGTFFILFRICLKKKIQASQMHFHSKMDVNFPHDIVMRSSQCCIDQNVEIFWFFYVFLGRGYAPYCTKIINFTLNVLVLPHKTKIRRTSRKNSLHELWNKISFSHVCIIFLI